MAAALLLLLSIVKCTEIGCPAAAAGMVQGVVPARRRDQDELERWCGRMKGEREFCILRRIEELQIAAKQCRLGEVFDVEAEVEPGGT
jgi:hypothetical protein